MRFFYPKKKDVSKQNIINFDEFNIKSESIDEFKHIINLGLKNYTLFQKHSNYSWPIWINYSLNHQNKHYRTGIPPILFNNILRDGITFSNHLSDEYLFIDPSGMISPSYSSWSIEAWLLLGDEIYKSSDNLDSITQKKNPKTSILETIWTDKNFKLSQMIFGARSNVDESIIQIECDLKNKIKDSFLFIVLRPYNSDTISGISAIEFLKKSNLIKINKKNSISLVQKPDVLTCGNSLKGDINLLDTDENTKVDCKTGMATLAAGFKLKKGLNKLFYSISLSPEKDIGPVDYEFDKLKQEFESFVNIRMNEGMNIKFNDKNIQNWFYSSKISLLNFLKNDYIKFTNKLNYKNLFFLIYGFNRMGYFDESKQLLEILLEKLKFTKKKIDFNDIIDVCFLILSFADYYKHVRDTDFLQFNYGNIKNLGLVFFNSIKKIKNIEDFPTNSIPEYSINEGHNLDMIIITSTLYQLSYLARCSGIFGDEKKYNIESKRFSEKFISLLNTDSDNSVNDFYFYNIFSGFPFDLNEISIDTLKIISKKIKEHFKIFPIHLKSFGWDLFSSLIISNNLIKVKDEVGITLFYELLELNEDKFVLPEFLNPMTKTGCWGNGDSKIISSIVFITIRNLLFIDNEDRLDLFPIPQEKWFNPGNEIIVENAPSRFGLISFRVVSTINEIQIHFEQLPKYVPPDIMISLPYKTKVQPGDDFIVKKVIGTSHIINGWPSILKFKRKI